MNYYKTGLQMPVRLLGHGRIHVGAAIPGDWEVSKYTDLANQLWGKASAPFAIISITRNGESFLVSPYQTKDEAADHYGTVTDAPGKAVYVAFFDSKTIKPGESPLIEDAFFQPTAVPTPAPPAPAPVVKTTTVTKKGPSNLALGFGVAATALAGMVAFGKKRHA